MSKIALALKYRPKTFEDVTEQNAVKATLMNQLKTNTIKNCYLFTGAAGTGKAQPLYSKVLTPTGFIEMKDVVVGTDVIGCDGKVHKVSDIYNRGVRDIYELTFSDRTKVRCCNEHLWTFQKQYDNIKKGYSTLSLSEILDKPLYKQWYSKEDGTYYKSWLYHLPVCSPADFPKKSVFIPPYIMGLLIADGGLTDTSSVSISLYEIDVREKFQQIIETLGYTIHLRSSTHPEVHDYNIVLANPKKGHISGTSNQIYVEIKNYGLNVRSEYKFIPADYLYNDAESRLELLQGLFDGDGYIDFRTGSSIHYTTTSPQLAENIAFLVRSLGGFCTLSGPKSSFYKVNNERLEVQPHYDLYIKFPPNIIPITSQKHLARYKSGHTAPKKTLRDIKYIGKEPCKCIMVDSEEHLYITDGYTVTHNTTDARIFANEINKGKGSPIEMDAASNNSVDDMRRITEQAKYQSIDSEYKVFVLDEVHAFSNAAWQSFLKICEEPPAKTIFILCTTDPQKIPNTILSRVQRYDFKKISFNGIVNRLNYIIEQENKEGAGIITNKDGIEYIAKLSDGGMRDAITTLDKCISYNKELTLENVIKTLGGVNYDTMFELVDSTYNFDAGNVIKVIETIYNSGANIKQFIKDFNTFVLDLCKYGLSNSFEYLYIPSLYDNKLKSYTNEHFTFFNQLLGEMIKLSTAIKWESNPKPVIESTFILLCQKV